jgi:hypothetical protein
MKTILKFEETVDYGRSPRRTAYITDPSQKDLLPKLKDGEWRPVNDFDVEAFLQIPSSHDIRIAL